jgi:hypothetical protein
MIRMTMTQNPLIFTQSLQSKNFWGLSLFVNVNARINRKYSTNFKRFLLDEQTAMVNIFLSKRRKRKIVAHESNLLSN